MNIHLIAGCLAMWIGLAQCAVAATAPASAKPNVVLILIDDLGYGDMSCNGHPFIKTPNIDKLNAGSIRLTDFHATPLCSPTRAELLSGMNNARIGVWATVNGRSIMPSGLLTMPQVFAANGYRTALFGKWHLGDSYPYRPMDRGFAECLFNGGGGVGHTPDYWGNKYIDDTYFHNGKPEKQPGYCTDVWFDHALQFIEANKARPFFCYIPTNVVHEPIIPPPGLDNLYADRPPEEAAYYRTIANLDNNIGRLLARLTEWGLEQNTIVIFSSDNGITGKFAKVYNAGMRGSKANYYEGGHRMPCFIRWPAGGLTGGKDVSQLAAIYDLLPTLVQLCQLSLPRAAKFDGIDLTPVLNGAASELPERTILELLHQSDVQPPVKGDGALLAPGWRLVGKELYDLRADPGQQHDLAAQNPQMLAIMQKEYERWWDEVSATFGPRPPFFLGDEHQELVRLTAHDWSGLARAFQNFIRRGDKANGDWAVFVERPGHYTISLRRWPAEADAPIAGTINDGGTAVALPIASARLRVGNFDQSQGVPNDARESRFTMQLPKGSTTLQTWFMDAQGKEICGAYYVEVQYTGP